LKQFLALGVIKKTKLKLKLIPEVQNKSNSIDYLVKILIVSLYSVQTFPLYGFCAIPL